MMEIFLKYVAPPAMTALGALTVAVMGLLVKWLNDKASTSKAARVGLVFGEMAQSVVAHLEVDLRPKLQQALADGTLSPEEGAELKAIAMKILMDQAPAGIKKAAEEVFGPMLGIWLSGLLERANTNQDVAAVAATPK